jgi:hypothetical protein
MEMAVWAEGIKQNFDVNSNGKPLRLSTPPLPQFFRSRWHPPAAGNRPVAARRIPLRAPLLRFSR